MLLFILLSLVLSVRADRDKDINCFQDSSSRSRGSESGRYNTSFPVRIEHQGDISDLWTSGNVYNLSINTVLQVNTTAQTIYTFCSLIQILAGEPPSFCKEQEPRVLSMIYNGTHVCGGMREKLVTIKNNTNTNTIVAGEEWTQCLYQCAVADQDSMETKFTYATYRLQGTQTDGNEPSDMMDILVVKGGVASNLGCISLVILFAWITRMT